VVRVLQSPGRREHVLGQHPSEERAVQRHVQQSHTGQHAIGQLQLAGATAVARDAGHVRVPRGRAPVARAPRGRAPVGRVRGAHHETATVGRATAVAGEPETTAAPVPVPALEPADPVLRAPARPVVFVRYVLANPAVLVPVRVVSNGRRLRSFVVHVFIRRPLVVVGRVFVRVQSVPVRLQRLAVRLRDRRRRRRRSDRLFQLQVYRVRRRAPAEPVHRAPVQ